MFWLSIALCHTAIVENDLVHAVQLKRAEDHVENDEFSDAMSSSDHSAQGSSSTTNNIDEAVTYQAASPDELALVRAAAKAGFEVLSRRANYLLV